MTEHRSVEGRKLGEMMLSSWTAARNYRELARCFQGWQAQALLNMAREAKAQGTCLAGIHALVTGEEHRPVPIPPDAGILSARLKKSYIRAMRLLTDCEAWSGDPEYGPVFLRLTRRQQDHCRKILEIIGSL